jgi:hypothetical protein
MIAAGANPLQLVEALGHSDANGRPDLTLVWPDGKTKRVWLARNLCKERRERQGFDPPTTPHRNSRLIGAAATTLEPDVGWSCRAAARRENGTRCPYSQREMHDPDRTIGLILEKTPARFSWSEETPWAWTEEEYEADVETYRTTWGTRARAIDEVRRLHPSMADDRGYVDWWHRYQLLSRARCLRRANAQVSTDRHPFDFACPWTRRSALRRWWTRQSRGSTG